MLNKIIEICNLDREEEADVTYATELEKTALMLIDRDGTGNIIDTLEQLRKDGPVYSGDITSKSGRDFLLGEGYATSVIVKGEQGFTALTYKGWDLHKVYNFILKEQTEAQEITISVTGKPDTGKSAIIAFLAEELASLGVPHRIEIEEPGPVFVGHGELLRKLGEKGLSIKLVEQSTYERVTVPTQIPKVVLAEFGNLINEVTERFNRQGLVLFNHRDKHLEHRLATNISSRFLENGNTAKWILEPTKIGFIRILGKIRSDALQENRFSFINITSGIDLDLNEMPDRYPSAETAADISISLLVNEENKSLVRIDKCRCAEGTTILRYIGEVIELID